MTSPALLVMAAGMGSRFGGLKQIEPVGLCGETIIDYAVFDALRAGFHKVVFVIRRDIEHAFRETIGCRFERQTDVQYVFQELDQLPPGFSAPLTRQKPWGTGQAILAASNAIHGPFAVINADDFYGAQSFLILAEHLRSGSSDYAMVGFILRNTLSEFGSVSRGVCQLDSTGFLQSVTELTKIERNGSGVRSIDASGNHQSLTGDEVVSMNMWGFAPAIFGEIESEFDTFLGRHGGDEKAEFYIPVAVNTLIKEGRARLRVLRTKDSWFGITYREDRPRVIQAIRDMISRGAYPELLWQ